MSSHGIRVFAVALLTIVACFLAAPAASGADPVVSAIAAEISQANVTSIIQTLEGYGTRYSYTSQCDDAADWLYATMDGYGLEVSFESFSYGGKVMRNVIARLPGSVSPGDVVVIGAHYDSTSQTPLTYAPGADDNASGVAAVLEAARILSGYEFESTVEFICYGGEEQGRQGSKANAAKAAAQSKNIVGMINLDMIGYWPPSSDLELDIGDNLDSAWLGALAENAALTYASIPVHDWPDTGVCFDDHVSYWEVGYDAIVLMDCYEAHFDPGGSGEGTPHYHSTTDTIATLDLAQTTEAVRASVAATAVLAGPIFTPPTLYVNKLPATEDVELRWSGGVPPFHLKVSTANDFSSGVSDLTPPGGTTLTEWFHSGVLYDGVDYYYRLGDP